MAHMSAETRKFEMGTVEPISEHFSGAEVTEAIRGLDSTALVRLRRIARFLARFSSIAADDLVQEACCRAMEETRVCPREMLLVPFLAGVMRSILSGAAKAHARHPEWPLDELMAKGRDWSDNAMTAEAVLIATEDEKALIERAAVIKRQVLGLFEDDLVAQTIAEGVMEGLEGEELRVLTELDKTAFASKRKFIRRRIAKTFPESAKS
jgi:DNA-directed RNA polymerase specialized sigma24 family protein